MRGRRGGRGLILQQGNKGGNVARGGEEMSRFAAAAHFNCAHCITESSARNATRLQGVNFN